MKQTSIGKSFSSQAKKTTKRRTINGQTKVVTPSLALGEDFYIQVLNSLEDYAVLVMDLAGMICWWNEGAERLLGYSQEEAIGRSGDMLFTEEDRRDKKPVAEMDMALSDGRALDERYHVRKDGSTFWGSGLLFPRKDQAGQAIGFTKILRDLSGRKDWEERFKMMVETSTDAIALSDKTGKYVYVSPAVERMTGYTLEEFSRMPGIGLVHPEDREMVEQTLGRVMTEEGGSAKVQTRYQRKDGSEGWVEITVTNLLGDSEVRAIVSNIRDITEDHRANMEAARLAAIVSSSEDAIVGKNLDGIIMSWNKAAERLFGYTAAEMIGQSILMIIPPELQYEEAMILSTLRRGGSFKHHETVRTAKDGTRIDVSLSISPVRDKSGRIVGASKIARDIREQKKLERQKEGFLGIASHELKTPVTSIKGYTQVLERRLRKSGEVKAAELLDKMDGQLNKLSALIDDLLDVTKLEAGGIQLEADKFAIDELVAEVVEQMSLTTTRHKIEWQDRTDAIVEADRKRVGQVLINFLSNAIKYSPSSRRVVVHEKVEAGEVLVGVQDFGVGIAESDQPRVFERFFRVSGPRQETFPGLGLGLYISSQIIMNQGGRIWVDSQVKKGSTFWFSLPIYQVQSQGED